MTVDLVLDLGLGIRHEDGRAVDRGTHLGTGSLESREELCVDQSGLGVLELMSNITREAEVRVLIDRAGNQARNIRASSENLGKSVGEGGCSLNRHKVRLAHVITVHKSKSRL